MVLEHAPLTRYLVKPTRRTITRWSELLFDVTGDVRKLLVSPIFVRILIFTFVARPDAIMHTVVDGVFIWGGGSLLLFSSLVNKRGGDLKSRRFFCSICFRRWSVWIEWNSMDRRGGLLAFFFFSFFFAGHSRYPIGVLNLWTMPSEKDSISFQFLTTFRSLARSLASFFRDVI